MALHIHLADRLAERAIDVVDRLLPARPLGLGAGQGSAVEGEGRVANGLGQHVGAGVEARSVR